MPARVLVVDDSSTVRKITRLVLSEDGYEVTAAADGHQAIEILREIPFDLVLVDFVMPRMNGYQFAQALRAMESRKNTPMVLISARAEQIGERFMKQTGALDAIAKPFSPDVLRAVVAHSLSRGSRGATPSTLVRDQLEGAHHDGPLDLNDDTGQHPRDVTMLIDASVVPKGPVGDAAQSAQARVMATTRAADLIAQAITPALTAMARENKRLTDGSVSDALVGVLDGNTLTRLARELRVFDEEARRGHGLEGQIRLVPLAEVMQLLRLQGQTGTLVVERAGAEVAVAFTRGNVDLASARNVSPEFLLGRYLIAGGAITREQLDALLATRGPNSGWLGGWLLSTGVISEETLQRALTRQTSEVIYEVLRWTTGQYRFEHDVVAPEAKSAGLGLPVESIALEGFRRVDEWRVIQEEIQSFDEVFARNEAGIETVGAARISPVERQVLDAVDGKRSVREVIQFLSMNSFDGCQILFRLVRANLLRRPAS